MNKTAKILLLVAAIVLIYYFGSQQGWFGNTAATDKTNGTAGDATNGGNGQLSALSIAQQQALEENAIKNKPGSTANLQAGLAKGDAPQYIIDIWKDLYNKAYSGFNDQELTIFLNTYKAGDQVTKSYINDALTGMQNWTIFYTRLPAKYKKPNVSDFQYAQSLYSYFNGTIIKMQRSYDQNEFSSAWRFAIDNSLRFRELWSALDKNYQHDGESIVRFNQT